MYLCWTANIILFSLVFVTERSTLAEDSYYNYVNWEGQLSNDYKSCLQTPTLPHKQQVQKCAG